MLVFEMVEVGRAAVRACWIGCDSAFDAGLTVVLSTTHDLDWFAEDFRAKFAGQLQRYFADKVERGAIVF